MAQYDVFCPKTNVSLGNQTFARVHKTPNGPSHIILRLTLYRWKTKLDISIRMEISMIVLLLQAVWKFQYGFQQIIEHVFVCALAMPSCFVS